MLRQRVITALILVPLIVGAILGLPSAAFAALIALVVLAGADEWARMTGLRGPARIAFVALTAVGLGGAWWALGRGYLDPLLAAGALWWLVAWLLVLAYPAGHRIWHDRRLVGAAIGLLVLVPSWTALVALQAAGADGPWYVLLLMFVIWAADTGAYFSGWRWGRHKLAPRVSPGKTWQGVAGGVVLALVVGFGLLRAFGLPLAAPLPMAGLLVVTVAFSVLGDLTESMFKRQAGIKDSGHLLPGHGGALDRIDSLTAAAPIFVLGLRGMGA